MVGSATFLCLYLLLLFNWSVDCWRIGSVGRLLSTNLQRKSVALQAKKPKVQANAPDKIISPFDSSQGQSEDEAKPELSAEPKIPLTWANVETVLDDVRPFLQSDGGDVELAGIDGGVIKLQLVGACGTCPSSQMTMKMGIERRLRERIVGIEDVVQKLPDAPLLNAEAIEGVLDNVRPFLNIAGGSIEVVKIGDAWASMQPSATLCMKGSASVLQSVKMEIVERIQKHFLAPIRVDWVQPEPDW